MNKKILLIMILFLESTVTFSQGFPWERPLKMAWSNDGISFTAPSIFQDSSGVPSVIRWKGDTLVCAFQWFRVPAGSATWDRVAVKFSYDNGLTWNQPVPIIVNGLPGTYQRPFDPALAALSADTIRMYFSSSDGMPNGGLDSTVNTYSAVSIDGINYSFEPAERVDEVHNKVIDPSVIFFHNAFHYVSPVGSPQQGAYHYLSPDGLNFMKVQDIPSDFSHNWTGNYMINDTNELRFYGCGSNGIWFNSTQNGGVWNGYVPTNLVGGDPGVVKTGMNNYLAIFVGESYSTGIHNSEIHKLSFHVFPNPVSESMFVEASPGLNGEIIYVYNSAGSRVMSQELKTPAMKIDISGLPAGMYLVTLKGISQWIKVERN